MRTRLTALVLSLMLGLALAVYAQTQTGTGGSASHEKGKSITLTGCLQPGSEPDTYMLKNVTMSRSGSSEAPREMARTETAYKLIPEGTVNLKDHVGHKVEVTGQEHEHSMSGASSSSYSGKREIPELKVSSIRHLAATCP